MRYFIFIAIVFGTFFTNSAHAEDINAGFVQGLWYSEEAVFEDVPTRIYVALRNNTDHDLTGTVRFSVNKKRIGSSDVRALSGRLVEAWVDWKPTYGEHLIVASVSNAELHIIGEGTQKIDIEGMTAEDTLFVDYDTDDDGIGNEEDTDDDGDGVSDEDEKERGSDPLVPNPTLTEEDEEKEDDDEEENHSPQSDQQTIDTEPREPRQGLERFVAAGVTNDTLTGVTNSIEETKKTLDAYREKRSQEKEEYMYEKSSSSTDSSGTATITRSQIETEETLLQKFVSGVSSLFSAAWSFILAIVSFILSFPMLIEIVLLWGILILIYRTAKRYGQRRRP